MLTLFSAVWSNTGNILGFKNTVKLTSKVAKQSGDESSQKPQSEDSSSKNSSENQIVITDSFDAVTNAGIQLDINKGFLLPHISARIYLIIKEKTSFSPVAIRLLGYYQNLFLSAILVNAP